MSTEIKNNDPCPLCLSNGVVNPLMDRPGQFFTYCRANHKFEDTTELNMLRDQARKKFPNFYVSPEVPAPRDMSNVNIVIDPESKKAIEELTGTMLTSASDLKGTIFMYAQDNKDKETEIRRLQASIRTIQNRASSKSGGPIMSNQVVITLPEWAMEGGIAEQAEHAGSSVEDWLNQEIGAYLENYFSRSPQRT